MVRCEQVIFSRCADSITLSRVQIGGDDNGAICVSSFIRIHTGNQGAGRRCSVFIREVRVKAQLTPCPQLPFSSPGRTTELSLIAGGLLERQTCMHAREDAEKMIFYRYNQIIFQSNNISLALQGKKQMQFLIIILQTSYELLSSVKQKEIQFYLLHAITMTV